MRYSSGTFDTYVITVDAGLSSVHMQALHFILESKNMVTHTSETI